MLQTFLKLKIVQIQPHRWPGKQKCFVIWWYERMWHPQICQNVFLGINYVPESCLRGCGLGSSALLVQNASQWFCPFQMDGQKIENEGKIMECGSEWSQISQQIKYGCIASVLDTLGPVLWCLNQKISKIVKKSRPMLGRPLVRPRDLTPTSKKVVKWKVESLNFPKHQKLSKSVHGARRTMLALSYFFWSKKNQNEAWNELAL